jgi:hypothetical protein
MDYCGIKNPFLVVYRFSQTSSMTSESFRFLTFNLLEIVNLVSFCSAKTKKGVPLFENGLKILFDWIIGDLLSFLSACALMLYKVMYVFEEY